MGDDLEKALTFIRDEIEVSRDCAEDPDTDEAVRKFRRVEVLLMSHERLRAQVAAAYEDAAKVVWPHPLGKPRKPTAKDAPEYQAVYEAQRLAFLDAQEIRNRTPADASAALDALLEKARREGQIKAGGVFATSGAEDRYNEDQENACPCCGGSGHKGDASGLDVLLDQARREGARAMREAALNPADITLPYNEWSVDQCGAAAVALQRYFDEIRAIDPAAIVATVKGGRE